MALEGLKRELKRFLDDRVGERFENHARRVARTSPRRRALNIAVGSVTVVAGMAMMVLPGPGGIAIAFGVAMIAGNSPRLAKRLDGAEVKLRRRMEPAPETP